MSSGALSTPELPVTEESEGYITILDTRDPFEVQLYEEAFFSVFVKVSSNRLVRKIWDWDAANERLKTKIPYTDQIIFAWKSPEGQIKCAVAFNLNKSKSQFGEYGFSVPGDKKGRFVEVLTLFAQNPERANGFRLDQFFFRPNCGAYMKDNGYDFALSTCAQRPLATYLRWGWEVIDEATIADEKRYFLFYDIHKNLQDQ
jgi:hypothetical protein